MQRMEELAMSFPSLVDKPGVKPWDAFALDAWASGPVLSHEALMSARLLLMIWDPYTEWTCGRFELLDALALWDAAHRAAFLRWAATGWRA